MISLGQIMEYHYRVLQIHRTYAHARTCAHTCAHASTNVHMCPCAHYTHTIRTLGAHYAHTMRTLCAHYAHNTRTLRAHYAHTTRTLRAHYVHNTCTIRAHYAHRRRRSGCRCSAGRWRSTVAGRWFIQINTRAGDTVSVNFLVFSRIKKLLGRTETRTRERKWLSAFSRYEQFDTSPEMIEQELRPAACELRQNYSIDNY